MAARSCNHSCSGKAIGITYSECVSVTLGIQHIQGKRHIILSSVACLALHYFSTLSHKRHGFRGKNVIEHKIYVMLFSKPFVCNIFQSKKNWWRYDHKCTWVFTWSTRYFCQILMKILFSRLIFEKFSNTKFHVNPSSGGRAIPGERTDWQTWRSY
jgi:hypothetical protein